MGFFDGFGGRKIEFGIPFFLKKIEKKIPQFFNCGIIVAQSQFETIFSVRSELTIQKSFFLVGDRPFFFRM